MKNKIFFSLFLIIFAASCKKPKDFYNELGKGSYLTLVNSTTLLNAVDPSSVVKITVNSIGSPVESINLYVSSTPTLDKTKWKLIKNYPFNGETTLSTTNAQIATTLGLTPGNIIPGSVFNFYNEIVTKDGQKYSSANTSDADLENQLAFNAAMKWTATVVCPYNAATVAGNYEVIRDDWADWTPGDIVEVSVGANANEIDISRVWPNPAFGTPLSHLTLKADPSTGMLTAPSGVIWGDYGNFKASTLDGSSGFVFSCTGRISLSLHINASGFGDQGFNQLILQKQ